MTAPVYLDYNASGPLDPRVAEVMVPVLVSGVGNASSPHHFGQAQAGLVEEAREQVAALVDGPASGVVFTSGATEANNLALQGVRRSATTGRHVIAVSAVEHASVLRTAQALASDGTISVVELPVHAGGAVDVRRVVDLVDHDVELVSVMGANSETGVLNPVGEIAEAAHGVGALMHCDVTQLVGRALFSMRDLDVDLVSLSSHKMYGPTGVGALVLAPAARGRIDPVLYGGEHERGLRAGSLNVAGIVGFGAACYLAQHDMAADARRVGRLRDRLVDGLLGDLSPGVVQEIGDLSCRLPNTTSVRFVGADAEAVLANMAPVAASTGSACSSNTIEPSHVLMAMGLDREACFEVVRFSLGRFTTDAEIDIAVYQVAAAVRRVLGLGGADAA